MTSAERREWRNRVFAHPDLTPASKLVLLALEGFADYPAGTNAHPGIASLAARCGLKDRAVRYALERGTRLGLIQQTARAVPKRGLAAVYRLTISGTVMPPDRQSSIGTDVPVEQHFKRHETNFQPARSGSSTGTSVPHTNPLTPIHYTERDACARASSPAGLPAVVENPPPTEEFVEAEFVDSVPIDVEPPRYCDTHPCGTHHSCKACAIARHNHTEWERRNPNSKHAAILARLTAKAQDAAVPTPFPAPPVALESLHQCSDCHDTGIVFKGGRPSFWKILICHHTPGISPWHEASADELAEPWVQSTLARLRAEYSE